MSASLDLNLLPLVSHAGQEKSALPGLHIAVKPRRTARGRQNDRLVFLLSLEGNAPMTSDRQEQLLVRLAQTYYTTPGSLTSALRAVAETLNQFLFERNLRGSSNGQQAIGLLTQLVLRDGRIVFAHSGPAHAFLITAEGAQHFFDPQLSGHGLGLGRTAPIRYFQAELKANDSLLLTFQPPVNWNSSFLSSLYGQGPESLRRRLASTDLDALLILVKTGSGKTFVMRPKPATPQAVPTAQEVSPTGHDKPPLKAEEPAPSEELAGAQAIPLPPPRPVEEIPSDATQFNQTPVGRAQPVRLPPEGQSLTQEAYQPSAFTPAQRPALSHAARKAIPATASKQSFYAPLARFILKTSQSASNILKRTGSASSILLGRMLPGDATSGLPTSVMAFFAIAIPLIVVTVGVVIYFRSGRASQFHTYYQQAKQSAIQAQAITDPRVQHLAWQNVLTFLDQAENYEKTSETLSLRNQAQQKLDELDGIKRLDFIPVLTSGLPQSFRVIRLAASGNELFILNETSGSVARAISFSNEYEIDEAFQCGPGVTGAGATGALIDVAVLPKGNQLNTSLLALDARGNLLSCTAGEAPKASNLTPPPTGFGLLKGFALEMDNVYVLDPEKNAVWIYWKSNFTAEPELFFSEAIPPMQDVIDLAVNENDLYLLHADGHITMCTYSNLDVSPTRCTDPAIYIDSRIGRENQPFIPASPFTQLLTTQPPDPSLYFLEPKSRAIDHFSLRLLTFHGQYAPAPIPGLERTSSLTPATAFTINPDNHLAYFAVGNQIFYASIP